jgi:spermidine synthase
MIVQDRPGSGSRKTFRQAQQPAAGVRGAEGSGQRGILIIIAFIAGAAVMIMELAANRILAPCFGNTLYTWTGLIGVILIALSGGYYAGGWLADFRCDYKTLSHLLAVSAGAIFLIPLSHRLVGTYLENFDPRLGPVLASTWLFALPGFLLGSLSPYIIRMVSLLSDDRHIGLSAGTIFMFSTLGSVIGTFGAGFFLIPQIQLDHIFVMIGAVLMALSIAGYLFLAKVVNNLSSLSLCLINLVLLILAAGKPPAQDATVMYDKNNFYHRIRVFQKETDNGDRMISLYLDTTFQGARYERSCQIPSRYQRFWALSRIFCPHLEQAVFLGGGAMVMPEAMLTSDPSLHVEVVEIDPQLFEVGRRFFRIDEYPQLTMIADDARRYLRLTDKKYDLIFGDVYHGVRNVPPHLLTQEFFRLVKDRLNDGGVFMMNLIGTVHGRQALLFQSTLNTINSIFKQSYVFAIDPDNLQQLQNIIIVATETDTPLADLPESVQDPLAKLLLSHYISKEKYTLAGAYLITDGCNPLEYLTATSISATNKE